MSNSIKMKLNDCWIGAIVPFDNLLDRFLDILGTFDLGVKHTLNAWLTIDSHIAGR